VRINDGGRTFVAKVTKKAAALDEIGRFRCFVQGWDPQLQPEAYMHGNAAVILLGLVRSDDDPSSPAEPIEQRILELWNDQWMESYDSAELKRRADAVSSGLERASTKLRELNCTSPSSDATRFTSFVNPPIERLDSLEARGLIWGLDTVAVEARSKAVTRLRKLERQGVVHGDIHLRNILIRGDSDIHLIDYASTGQGHPAIDLVRLELALYLSAVRQFESDARCAEFQTVLSIERAAYSNLEARFPVFFQCYVNRACARGMIAARNEAVAAVTSHGGNANDYLAVKYLVAWQSLGLIGVHTGLARAVISGLAREIASW
jgi:hypothetical protein